MCGNIILSGICANDFSPWGCSLKNESSSSSNSSSISNSNSSSNPSSISNPNSNSSSNPSSSSNSISISGSGSNPSSSSSSGSGSIYDYNSNSDPNPNPNPNLIPNPNPNHIPNHNLNPSSEVLTRCCNKCNYIRSCRSCTSAKVNCPYCTSVVRYDGIRAHVKKQHPDIELTRGFSRNITDRCNRFADKTINPSWQSPRAVSPLVINQTEESCSCKYYNFVSFLINNGINIEKIKENINLLKSIDNLK